MRPNLTSVIPTSATFVMNSEVDLSTDIGPVILLPEVEVSILLVEVLDVSIFALLVESAFCTLSFVPLLHAKASGANRITAIFFIIFLFLINKFSKKVLQKTLCQ